MFRVRHSVEILASLDSAEKKVQFSRLGDATTKTIRSDFTVGKSDTRVIAASTTDEVLVGSGGVSAAAFLYLEASAEVTVKINGTNSLKLVPLSGSVAKLMWEGEFNSLVVTNADPVNDVTITYLVAGS